MLKRWAVFPILLLVGVVSGGCTRISPGYVGIVVNLAGSQRGVSDFPITTGWVVYNPGATQVEEYPTFVQTAVWTKNVNEGNPKDEEITFTTKDSMVVSVDVNLSYSLDPARVPHFYVKFRSDNIDGFTHGFLRNLARDCFNEVAGKYSVEQIMGDNAPFLKDARNCLQNDVETLLVETDSQGHQIKGIGVHIEQFGIIGAPRPPEAVINAINLKVQAAQIALQKQNEVQQAEAEAKKAVAQAKGQADANRELAAGITPQLIEWQKLQLHFKELEIKDRWIARWNGQKAQVELGDHDGGQLLYNLPAPK